VRGLLEGRGPALSVWIRIALTFAVPFLVSLVSSALADRSRERVADGDRTSGGGAGPARIPRGERDVVLVIADISGYTNFMVANRTELAHSQQIIGALLEAVLDEVEIPLKVSKFEGDAVFLYMERQDDGLWPTRLVEKKLPRFFTAFRSRLHAVASSLTCSCGACGNVTALRLKLVVHAGTALFYEIAGHAELAGVDVIIVHRLLKNSVAASEYVLLTGQAGRHLNPELALLGRSTETYSAIGEVDVIAYAPPDEDQTAAS
jgi:class 3 adenylate cyclase